MLSVYICEDDKFQLDYITECIEKCIFISLMQHQESS